MQEHGDIASLGFRFGNLAYSCDLSTIPPESVAALTDLDVWIVETNTAYKAVPFETVANWLQQGRLLAEDRVRPAGTQDWFQIDSVRALDPYVPQTEPQRIDDEAEALRWARRDGTDGR